MLSPQQVMRQPGSLIVSIIPINIMMIYSVQLHKSISNAYGGNSYKLAYVIPWTFAASPIAGLLVGFIFNPKEQYLLALTALVVVMGVAGCWITWYVLDRLANAPLKRGDPRLMVMVPLGLMVWLGAFPIAGAYLQTQRDKDSTIYGRVELVGAEDEDWHLVTAVGDRLLNVSATESGEARAYRLIDPAGISRTFPSRRR